MSLAAIAILSGAAIILALFAWIFTGFGTPVPPNAVFLEKGASGGVGEDSATNILMVAVTDTELVIRTQLPFGFIFRGIDRTIAKSAITGIKRDTRAAPGVVVEAILVEHRGPGGTETYGLMVRDTEGFLAALRRGRPAMV